MFQNQRLPTPSDTAHPPCHTTSATDRFKENKLDYMDVTVAPQRMAKATGENLVVASLVATSLFLTLTACSADEEQAKSAADGCAELLGKSGMEWAHGETGADELERSGVSLDSAREEYYRQMDPWKPKASRWESELCTMSAASGEGGSLKIEFGPSSLPLILTTKRSPTVS
ncbi:hypothetical protein SHKM778_22120 [Streptomyces sp. KM77-8]|uniref:Lipoprotein n=1 Tax=Streptomyces haneummycinicus TaxID=3074435 RepID=A0AAT9HEF3_9ACTN